MHWVWWEKQNNNKLTTILEASIKDYLHVLKALECKAVVIHPARFSVLPGRQQQCRWKQYWPGTTEKLAGLWDTWTGLSQVEGFREGVSQKK